MFLPSNITLKPGDSGDFVAELQRRLAVVDCFSHDMINGFYDGSTANGVMAFQGRSGLRGDGIAGPETLRRLNGTISGDTSSGSTDNKQEEETKQQAAASAILNQELVGEQHPQNPFLAEVAEPTTPAVADPFSPATVPSQFAAPTTPSFEQQNQQAIQREWVAAQPVHAASAMLAHDTGMPNHDTGMGTSMPAHAAGSPPITAGHLASIGDANAMTYNPAVAAQGVPLPSHAPQHQAAAAAVGQPAPAHQASPTAAAHPLQAPAAAQQTAAMGAWVAPTASASAMTSSQSNTAAPHQRPAITDEPQQPRSVVGRAMQYANDMVQKLANYFEAKLPSSVIQEVQAIGQSMAQHGVKEVPIPQEPTMRAPELPSRGPQQAQATAPQRHG